MMNTVLYYYCYYLYSISYPVVDVYNNDILYIIYCRILVGPDFCAVANVTPFNGRPRFTCTFRICRTKGNRGPRVLGYQTTPVNTCSVISFRIIYNMISEENGLRRRGDKISGFFRRYILYTHACVVHNLYPHELTRIIHTL